MPPRRHTVFSFTTLVVLVSLSNFIKKAKPREVSSFVQSHRALSWQH